MNGETGLQNLVFSIKIRFIEVPIRKLELLIEWFFLYRIKIDVLIGIVHR